MHGSGPEGQVTSREAGGGQTDRHAGRWDGDLGYPFDLQGTESDTRGVAVEPRMLSRLKV